MENKMKSVFAVGIYYEGVVAVFSTKELAEAYLTKWELDYIEEMVIDLGDKPNHYPDKED
jgi:hypothetical protein